MRFTLRSHEGLALFLGALGLVEQEAVRLIWGLEASSVLSPIFGSMVLAAIGAGAIRGIRSNGK